MSVWLAVLLLGAVGVGVRVGLNGLPLGPAATAWGTFAANSLGCFFIGWVFYAKSFFSLSDGMKLAVMAGLLGGLTTFSGLSLETLRFWERGQSWWAVIYLIGSNLVGLTLLLAGRWWALK